jgi:hypothetical protein
VTVDATSGVPFWLRSFSLRILLLSIKN